MIYIDDELDYQQTKFLNKPSLYDIAIFKSY